MLACLSAWWRVLARAYMQVSKQDEDEWAAAFNGEAVQESAANHTQVSQPVPTAKGPKDAKGSAVMDTPWTPAEQVHMCAHMCVCVCLCVCFRALCGRLSAALALRCRRAWTHGVSAIPLPRLSDPLPFLCQALLEDAMRSVDKTREDRWDRYGISACPLWQHAHRHTTTPALARLRACVKIFNSVSIDAHMHTCACCSISDMVPSRTRKEILARVKELKRQLSSVSS